MPFISIIIPTFNSAATLAVTLQTVLAQTYQNFEVLIIDNCSTDASIEIAKSFKDNRIKIFIAKDKGVYDAMNKGIGCASGEWIYFLGSDDWLYNNEVLQDVYEFIRANNCEVVYGNITSTRFGGVYGGSFDADKLLIENIGHQAIFFHKNVFKKAGNFNLHYKAQADWDHNMRWFFSKNIKHCYFDLVIAVYSDRGLSADGDALFEQHRIANYVKHAGNRLPLKKRFSLLKYAFDKARREKRTGLAFYILMTGVETLVRF
jgi:glycosyltransferase involved in cell wall biosynthesis